MGREAKIGLGALGAALLAAGVWWALGPPMAEPVRDDKPPGKWRVARPAAPAVEALDPRIAELEAIGYVSGSREIVASRIITRHDPSRAVEGLNLFHSQHAPEAYLVDMDGRERHRWALSYAATWPGDDTEPVSDDKVPHWRRIALGDQGDLYAIFEGRGIVHLDVHSQRLWARRNRAHHDLHVYPDGRIAVLTRRAHLIERLSPTEPILEDAIQILAPDGTRLREISLLEAFERSDHAHHWLRRHAEGLVGDIFHTNSLELLDGEAARFHPAFQQGRALVSMRELDTIAVVDLDTEEVVWAFEGDFRRQHDPTMLPGGRIMVFDNGPKDGERSRVLVYQLPSMEVVWSFPGEGEVLYSGTLGAAQPLPGGHVVITESTGGRVLEVTPEGEVVWELYNPNRAGTDGRYIAAIPELIRLPGATDLPWASSDADTPPSDEGAAP